MATLNLLFVYFILATAIDVDEAFISSAPPVPSVDCQSLPQSRYPFCNYNLSAEDRASDLVSRLTLSELYAQCNSDAPGIPRLGIKSYDWRSNCLHGWSKSGGMWPKGVSWTVFPTPLGLAATFDMKLVRQVGAVTADEGRALHNVMLMHYSGSSTEAAGLNCFSPNVNLFRDPRWGRGKETFGEDPYLISALGVAYTRGLQEGEDPRYLKIAACAKHYAVHDGPEDIRNSFTANVSLHDLFDTFLPSFESQAYSGNVAQIMTALSGTNTSYQPDGAPDTANTYLLQEVLRSELNCSNISTISDNGAVGQVFTAHHYVSSFEMAAAVCMNATTDLDLHRDHIYSEYLPKAVMHGLVSLSKIERAVWRSLHLRIKLGDFDPYNTVYYQQINDSHLNTIHNQALNLKAAQESIVLQKNYDSVLPLEPSKIRKITIVGPLANATDELLANYAGIPSSVTTIASALENYPGTENIQFTHAPACIDVACENTTAFAEAATLARNSDYVIAIMGLNDLIEGEGHDRKPTYCEGQLIDELALPGCQEALITLLAQSKVTVILVLVNGGPITFKNFSIYIDSAVPVILEAFYPGSRGGEAIANVIFGKYNPAGRMPVTTVISSSDLRNTSDYRMSYKPGRTYRYFKEQTLIPFGFGLSYTKFAYSDIKLSSNSLELCDKINISVAVVNIGNRTGDEVVQVYLMPPSNDIYPIAELVGFTRIQDVMPSEKRYCSFIVSSYLLSLVHADGRRYIVPGKYKLSIGGKSPGKSFVADDNNIEVKFDISGEKLVPLNYCEHYEKCMVC